MAGNTIRFSAFLDDKVSTPLAKIRDRFDTLGKSKGFKSVAQGVGIGAGISAFNLLGQAVSKAFDFVGDSIGKASALGESVSKSNVVFGESAKNVEAWGGTLARSFGISKQAGIEAAASFGNVFVGLDLGEQKAAEMSKTMVELAGDLASFNNLPTDVALEKLRSGLAGEAEPLRSMGVFLNEAKVKAKAMELGLVGVNGEVSEGAKITARYNLILDETTTAQGDVERTSDSLANTQRRLAATTEDLAAAWGEKLTPAAASWNEFMIELLSQLFKSENATRLLRGELDLSTVSMEEQARILAELTGAGYTLEGEFGTQLQAVKDSVEGFDRLNRQMERGKDRTSGFSGSVKVADDRLGALDRKLRASLIPDLAALREAAATTGAAIANLLFPPSLSRRAEETRLEISLVRSEIKQLAAIKDPTREQQLDLLRAKDRLVELQGELFETRTQMALLGDAKIAGELADSLLARYKEVRKMDKAAEELYATLRRIASLKLPPYVYGRDTRGKAHGGPVHAGQTYTVGEQGPETLVMGSAGGFVIPNGGSSGGGGTVVSFTYAPGYSSASVAEAQAFSRNVLPELVREMRRQRILA